MSLPAVYIGKNTCKKINTEESFKLDFLYLTELYRPIAVYLNMGQNSGMNLFEMQAYVWKCVCRRGRGGFRVYSCGAWGAFGGMKGVVISFMGTFYT